MLAQFPLTCQLKRILYNIVQNCLATWTGWELSCGLKSQANSTEIEFSIEKSFFLDNA